VGRFRQLTKRVTTSMAGTRQRLDSGPRHRPNPVMANADARSDDRSSHPLESMFAFAARYIDLSEAEREIMARTCDIRSVEKGRWISMHLEEDPLSYFVLKGTVV